MRGKAAPARTEQRRRRTGKNRSGWNRQKHASPIRPRARLRVRGGTCHGSVGAAPPITALIQNRPKGASGAAATTDHASSLFHGGRHKRRATLARHPASWTRRERGSSRRPFQLNCRSTLPRSQPSNERPERKFARPDTYRTPAPGGGGGLTRGDMLQSGHSPPSNC